MLENVRRHAALLGCLLLGAAVVGCGGGGGGGNTNGGALSLLGRWSLAQVILTDGSQVAVPATVTMPDSSLLSVDRQVWEFLAGGSFISTAGTADTGVSASGGTWSLDGNRVTLTYQRDGEDTNGNGTVEENEWSATPEPETMHATVAANGSNGLRLTYEDGSALAFGIAGATFVPAS